MKFSCLSITRKEGRFQRKLLAIAPDDRVQQSVKHAESHLKNDSQDILPPYFKDRGTPVPLWLLSSYRPRQGHLCQVCSPLQS